MDRLAGFIDRLCGFCHGAAAFLCLVLVGLTTEQVIARYFFEASSIAMQELEWHCFGAMFLLGAATTLRRNAHVRVDIVYGRLDATKRRYIDLAGTLLFLVPTCIVLIWTGTAFVASALSFDNQIPPDAGAFTRFLYGTLLAGEASPDPGGLPARWILKAIIPLGAGLLFLQGLAMAWRLWRRQPEEAT